MLHLMAGECYFPAQTFVFPPTSYHAIQVPPEVSFNHLIIFPHMEEGLKPNYR